MIKVKYNSSFSFNLSGAVYHCQEDNIDELEDLTAKDLIDKGLAQLFIDEVKYKRRGQNQVKPEDKSEEKVEQETEDKTEDK